MNKKYNVEIKNNGLTQTQIAEIKSVGLTLDTKSNKWSGIVRSGQIRRAIWNWCREEKMTCWIQGDYRTVLKTEEGRNVSLDNIKRKAEKKRRKKQSMKDKHQPKIVIIGGGFKCKR